MQTSCGPALTNPLVLAQNYFPVVFSYQAQDGGRKWDLKFKSLPSKEVIFSGDIPTRDEIIQCLTHTAAPIWIIAVIEVVIADAIARTAGQTDQVAKEKTTMGERERDELAQAVPKGGELKTVRRGQVITLENYGRVKFVRLDYYMGETTARLSGLDSPGTYYPFLKELEREGFEVIDA